jgi:hypothetical protein
VPNEAFLPGVRNRNRAGRATPCDRSDPAWIGAAMMVQAPVGGVLSRLVPQAPPRSIVIPVGALPAGYYNLHAIRV